MPIPEHETLKTLKKIGRLRKKSCRWSSKSRVPGFGWQIRENPGTRDFDDHRQLLFFSTGQLKIYITRECCIIWVNNCPFFIESLMMHHDFRFSGTLFFHFPHPKSKKRDSEDFVDPFNSNYALQIQLLLLIFTFFSIFMIKFDRIQLFQVSTTLTTILV